jgi:hypothetical protein
VTFELPSGTYLFAATANGPASTESPVCCVCEQTGVATPAAKTNGSASTEIAYPCYYSSPPVEYGYSLTQVSGATTLTIPTQLSSSIPTTDISVSVSFENGTAVSGAYVSTSVVGSDFYWGNDSNLTMYAQTSADGVAQLVVPAVPLVVTSSESVQVDLPQNQTTTQVNVGGQPVNVTLYYSPNYVYLSASALLVPPQTTLSMVVTAQPQSPIVPYAEGSATPGVATTNVDAGAPATSSQATSTAGGAAGAASNTASTTTSIPPIPASDLGASTSTHSSSSASGVTLSAVGIIALAGAVAAIVGIGISKTKR